MFKERNLVFVAAVILALFLLVIIRSPEIPFDQLENRQGIYYVNTKKESFTGTAIERYKSGTKKKKIVFKNGKKNGECTGWYENGQKQYRYHCLDGKKHGKEIHWFKNGKKKGEVSFENGKLNDKWIQWYDNGKKKEEIGFVLDQKHGEWREWYENGQIKYQGVFYQWKYHGKFVDWYKNGQREFERSAIMGIPHGKWIRWNPDGSKKAEGEWKKGQPHDTWVEYYKDGKRKEIIQFRTGKRHGKWIQWHANGNQKFSGEWINGEISGQWMAWSTGGTHVKLETFPFLKAVYQFYKQEKENRATGKKKKSPFVSAEEILSTVQIKTLKSLRKVDSYPLYVMDYFNDYNLDAFLGNFEGMKENPALFLEIKDKRFEKECSTFSALGAPGQYFLGRNQDNMRDVQALLLFTRPPGRYASVSLLDVRNTRIGKKNLHSLPLKKRSMLLNAPFWPHDGMNECGLAIGHMRVEGDRVYNPIKVTIHGMRAIRMVLDYAKNVDEAIRLLENINIFRSEQGHFLIADAAGKSAVIEYIDGKMVVMRNLEPWQVATNFMINNGAPGEIRHLCDRYNTAYMMLKRSGGGITRREAMKILKRISMNDEYKTQWSVVYNLHTKEVDVSIGRNYRDVKSYKLK